MYEDLQKLFKENLDQNYTKEDYVKQFTTRIPNLLAKFDRIENIYKTKVDDTPQVVYETFAAIKTRLTEAKEKYGDFISPFDLQ
jgi:phosphoenolpyruvate carboxykinase (GTP)